MGRGRCIRRQIGSVFITRQAYSSDEPSKSEIRKESARHTIQLFVPAKVILGLMVNRVVVNPSDVTEEPTPCRVCSFTSIAPITHGGSAKSRGCLVRMVLGGC